ncbi:hypothetical protein REPUB_Repub09cG0172400 [Reevesia pubescens]
MTSHDSRDNDHSMFTSKTPHFFKVILEETIRDGKLGIPRNFVRDYGKQLSSPIQLEVPSGAIWQVELTKCDERVWLQKATKGAAGITARRSAKTEVFSCVQRLTATEKAHAFQIAGAFKRTENPVFMVVMRPSIVRYKYRLFIPSNFASKFLTMQNGNLTLCNSGGKTWPAKYYCSAENKKPNAQLHGGWRAFAEDNKLDVGDICVFELIKHPEILMKVVIYPVVENASKACIPLANGSIAGRVKIRSIVSDTELNCGQSRCPSSSREFKDPKFKENEKIHPCIEILDDFPLKQKTKKKLPSPCFQPWKMMGTNPIRSIQATKGIGITARRSVKTEVLSCAQRLTATEKAHAIQRASAFKSTENPVLYVVMQPSFVSCNYRMIIPLDFTRRFLTMQHGNLTLCNSNGKTWPAKYYRTAENKKPKAYIHGGWRAFVEDNNLDVGDICVFELIKHPEILMKVVIYPVVENASKACRSLAHGSIDSRVKIRSLVSDTELDCWQSQCPSSSRESKDSKIEENENIHSSIEISDDFLLNQKKKMKSPSPCFQPCSMMRTNPSGSIQAKGIKLEKQKKSVDFQYSTKELRGKFKYCAKEDSGEMSDACRCQKPDLLGKIQPLTPTEKERACIRASGFKSANPSFTVMMRPSYVLTGGSLVGDICVFELIKENGTLFEVFILSAADIASSSSSRFGE